MVLYKQMPARMMVEEIYFCTMWLNAVPNKNGVSDEYLPCEIVEWQKLNYKKHCGVPFGAYCEEFDDCKHTNTMESHMCSAISLGPMVYMQKTYKFLCLNTGRVIKK